MSDNKGHVHAESMALYAQDALKTDEPWKLWEYHDDNMGLWKNVITHPSWDYRSTYRRKPEMITVGKVSFPKPVDYKLDYGVEYFYPNLYSRDGDGYGQDFWYGGELDCLQLKIGFIHLTKEAAQQHFDALIKINKGEF
ncbi:hypothetical protein CE143_14995 [Photorhabdus luminescens]|uniref:Uncharacterized protein n=1 Tax=Photorhabdus akhurstii TaxID=171438 RepID=A0ABX8LWL2_9GAMM|nr:hypothetical protein [Photorhabdus akhurstii]QXF34310.1 hypothetical protein B0X70_15000 [Photorhabdus akhurstii]UJD76134.1 hypothetical protein CE143_14995 [Photorhabdus luminescens]